MGSGFGFDAQSCSISALIEVRRVYLGHWIKEIKAG